MTRTFALICFAVFLAVASLGSRHLDASPVVATIYGVCLGGTTVMVLAVARVTLAGRRSRRTAA